MLSLFRGLLAGFLVAGVAALCSLPTDLAAQDAKKDKEKFAAEVAEKKIGVTTSDGLSLAGYFFQGKTLEKQRPDAVIMYPPPGGKITDAWIDLAHALSEKNFSVLLFDFRGCGMNGPEGAGYRAVAESDVFWKEPYNGLCLRTRKADIEKRGLDFKVLASISSPTRYRDFLYNDLMAARFFMDKQNDAGKCNTNRVWLVSEKDGVHLGMGFIAAEFQRNTIYEPQRKNFFDVGGQYKAAGKDYTGVMAMSYAGSGTAMSATANMVYRNALPSSGPNQNVKEAKLHLEEQFAMVLMHTKAEGPGQSRALVQSVNAAGTPDQMKKKFKYIKEFDTGKPPKPGGIGLIDPMDSFGAKEFVVEAMAGISKAQPRGKDPTEREAGKMVNVPRFAIELFNK